MPPVILESFISKREWRLKINFLYEEPQLSFLHSNRIGDNASQPSAGDFLEVVQRRHEELVNLAVKEWQS